MKKIDTTLAIGTLVSCAVFWILYSLANASILPGAFYYVVWIGGFGGLLWNYRAAVEKALQRWALHPLLKFLLLGYGAVLLEEILAAFSNNLTEGFSLPLFLLRISQFWAFNILAFTGLIVGWYVLLRYVRFSRREVFYLSGAWGVYAEHLYVHAFTNPIAFACLLLPTIFTYGVIMAPAMMSVRSSGTQTFPAFIKYCIAFTTIFTCSLLPTGLLLYLRASYPGIFPPETFIQ